MLPACALAIIAPTGGDQMQVRVYGDVGIANGIVLTTDEQGRELERIIFTDVFVRRNGRWEAVNAQENAVGKH